MRIAHSRPDRGTKDSRQRLAVLHEKWPPAFPLNKQDVRRLTESAPGEIAVEMS